VGECPEGCKLDSAGTGCVTEATQSCTGFVTGNCPEGCAGTDACVAVSCDADVVSTQCSDGCTELENVCVRDETVECEGRVIECPTGCERNTEETACVVDETLPCGELVDDCPVGCKLSDNVCIDDVDITCEGLAADCPANCVPGPVDGPACIESPVPLDCGIPMPTCEPDCIPTNGPPLTCEPPLSDDECGSIPIKCPEGCDPDENLDCQPIVIDCTLQVVTCPVPCAPGDGICDLPSVEDMPSCHDTPPTEQCTVLGCVPGDVAGECVPNVDGCAALPESECDAEGSGCTWDADSSECLPIPTAAECTASEVTEVCEGECQVVGGICKLVCSDYVLLNSCLDDENWACSSDGCEPNETRDDCLREDETSCGELPIVASCSSPNCDVNADGSACVPVCPVGCGELDEDAGVCTQLDPTICDLTIEENCGEECENDGNDVCVAKSCITEPTNVCEVIGCELSPDGESCVEIPVACESLEIVGTCPEGCLEDNNLLCYDAVADCSTALFQRCPDGCTENDSDGCDRVCDFGIVDICPAGCTDSDDGLCVPDLDLVCELLPSCAIAGCIPNPDDTDVEGPECVNDPTVDCNVELVESCPVGCLDGDDGVCAPNDDVCLDYRFDYICPDGCKPSGTRSCVPEGNPGPIKWWIFGQ